MAFGVAANPMGEPARITSGAVAEHVRREVAAFERRGDRCGNIERSTTIGGDRCDRSASAPTPRATAASWSDPKA